MDAATDRLEVTVLLGRIRGAGRLAIRAGQRSVFFDLFVALFVDILERAERQRDTLAGSGYQWIFLLRYVILTTIMRLFSVFALAILTLAPASPAQQPGP